MSYVIKGNPAPEIPEGLAMPGMRAFDEASPVETDLVRAHLPGAALHYHKPLRLRVEFVVGAVPLGPSIGSASSKS
ncbi:hypothetical protein Q4543_13250 [Salipiger sp. 1_MG-2023]|uniref:hypothetical protein n=1 Tax=Salipiger sp. 1_MG-2023 TaxID=3062665 RepID=UPI0026E29C17|nr:hypothetical protein [Salipiger sp. 1_MG-2023]MDO6586480.1 hypothetical protein [Salipiger sp. 1_MG-2023]